MRVAIDTNVIAYAEGFDDDLRGAEASRIVTALAGQVLVVPVQVSAELMSLVVRKFKRSSRDGKVIVDRWRRLAASEPETTPHVLTTALGLVAEQGLQIFDAIILASSAEAGCGMVLSEDMQDGFVWRGVTIVNPFADAPHPMLVDLMQR